MTIDELIKNPKLMHNLNTVRDEDNFVLNLVDPASEEVVYSFQFETARDMRVADCNLFNAKFALAVLDRTCEYAVHFKTGPNKSQKTGFKR